MLTNLFDKQNSIKIIITYILGWSVIVSLVAIYYCAGLKSLKIDYVKQYYHGIMTAKVGHESYLSNQSIKEYRKIYPVDSVEAVVTQSHEETIGKLVSDQWGPPYFDVIIYSDILEHLKRPDLVVISFKKYLKLEGIVIASIPNIGRLEYRIRHLFGNFDYEPSGGILSRTHLRFFTLKTAKRLFEDAGYEIVNIDHTGLASKLKIFPELLAFQFVIIAKKTLDDETKT